MNSRSLASDAYEIFGDEDFAGLIAYLERDTCGQADGKPEKVSYAKQFLRALGPVLDSIKQSPLKPKPFLSLLEVAAEAVARPLMTSPRTRAREAWLNHVEAVKEKRRKRGRDTLGRRKLSVCEQRLTNLFLEGSYPKSGWLKDLHEKIAIESSPGAKDAMNASRETISNRLKELGLKI